MPEHRKKLIEVALPLDAINEASAYDKMPGIGPHPKGIHHWWARLPLPCARAVLFASLVDDPSSDPAFAEKSQSVQHAERERLFGVLRALLQKKIHERPEAFARAHTEIVRATDGNVPSVLDPFCGGGSIPLEAQRLGLEGHASDLNPVAVLITRAMVEAIPRFAGRPPVNPISQKMLAHSGEWSGGKGLADDVRYYGHWILERAREQLGHLYPKAKLPKERGGGNATATTWIWTRTVQCPNPACRAWTPLVRSFALATRKDKRTWIEPLLDRTTGTVSYQVRTGSGHVPTGTVTKKGAACLFCNQPILFEYVRMEGRSGRIVPQLMAIAAQHARRRVYLSPQPEHVEAAQKADGKDFPDTDIPEKALGFRVQPYGMTKHRDLFTPRQLQTLNLFADRLREVHDLVLSDARSMEYRGRSDDDRPLYQGGAGARAYADAVVTFLAFSLSRCADFNNALCRWSPSNEKVMNLFGRAAIPMTWDYAEANPLADSVGGWSTCSRYVADCVEIISTAVRAEGVVRQRDAAKMSPTRGHLLVSTDPPYYGNIGYADLSDFFYVWLRRTIGDLHPDVCGTLLVPKTEELVATPERFGGDKTKAKEHFEGGLKRAFSVLKEKIDPRFPMTVYYAFKQADEEAHEEETEAENGAPESQVDLTTGWETMLEALITGGFQITGTWPVRASQAWRMRAMGSNALASYVVLACRARPEDAAPAARREFLATLRKEVPEALNRLQRSNIAPVDLAQAAIGPGMAVFSRYSRVLEADGSPMSVRTALALINQALDEYLTQQEGEMDADTRWALAWFEQFGIEEGPFGVAETLSKAKNTAVNALEQAGILRARGGKVRLLGRNELPDSWDPAADEQLTVWEATQHLIRELEKNGESAAAALLRQLGGLGEEVRALAYRLYTICDRKGWAQEALAYNMLVVAWPRLLELASARKPEQMGFLG